MKGKLLFLTADVFHAAVQALVIIMIAFRFGAGGVAAYGFAVSLSMPITTFFSASLRKVAATSDGLDFGAGEVFYFRHALSCLTVGAVAIAVVIYTGVVSTDYILLFLVLTVYKTVERYYELLQGLYQKENRRSELAINNIIRSLGFLFAFVSGSYMLNSLPLVYLFCSLVLFLFIMHSWRALCGISRYSFNDIFGSAVAKAGLQALLRLGLPLAFLALLISLNIHLPRLMMERQFDEDIFASFVLQMNFFSMFTVLIISFGQYSLASLGRAYQNREYKLYLKKSIKVTGAAVVVYMLFWVFMSMFSYALVTIFYADVIADVFHEVLAGVLKISLPLMLVTSLSFVVFPINKHSANLAVNSLVISVLVFVLNSDEIDNWFNSYTYVVWFQALLTMIFYGLIAWREHHRNI